MERIYDKNEKKSKTVETARLRLADSNEYEQAGGTRKSEKKKPAKNKDKPPTESSN